MSDLASIDFFTDPSLIEDSQPYFDHLRSQCPIVREPHHGVMTVTGRAEAAAILADGDTFSSCVAAAGPFPPLPFEPIGDDITELVDEHRAKMPLSKHIATMDPPDHTRVRSLLSRMFTPRRLEQHEEFLWGLADRVLDEFVDGGRCEVVSELASPFATLMILHLLGFPEMTPQELRDAASAGPPEMLGNLDQEAVSADPLMFMHKDLIERIEDRRHNPREDLMTELATATYPDGSTPDVLDVVRPVSFLLAAGAETTSKLLSSALQVLGDRPDIQQQLRDDRSLIAIFTEECLRFATPVKTIFRLARKSTTVAGVDIPAGTIVMVCPEAVNRDPRSFTEPHEFRLDRKNARDHVTFSRGAHSCLGASLARSEFRVAMNRILDRMADIAIDEDKHGPADDRRYVYEPNFLMRGLTELYVTFSPLR